MYASSFWLSVKSFFKLLKSPVAFSKLMLSVVIAPFDFHRPSWELENSIKNSQTAKPTTGQMLNPIRWFKWVIQFLWEWLLSRPYRNLIPAIPAVVLAGVFGGIAYQIKYPQRGARKSQYRNLYDQALSENRLDEAVIVLASLIEMDPDSETLRFQKALLEEKRGDHARAVELMQRLVVSTQSSRAALWLVTNEIDLKNAASWTIETHQQFRSLTGVALEAKDQDSRTKAEKLMGSYLLAINAKKDAVKYLGSLATRDQSFALPTAVVYNDLGDKVQARFFADMAANHFRQMLVANPANKDARLNLAKALSLQALEQQASDVLLEGAEKLQDVSLRTQAGEVLIYRIRRLGEEGNPARDLVIRLADAKRALELAPDSQLVMDVVIDILFECRSNKNNEIAVVRSALAQGLDPKAVHFVRGTLALFENQFDTAKKELQLAIADGAQMPGVLNNLAMAILSSDSADLQGAFQMSELANQLLPNHPYLRDTRGQILVKMKRYEEAIPDLEFALRAQEIARAAHASLALVYRELGNEQLATLHESLSKSK